MCLGWIKLELQLEGLSRETSTIRSRSLLSPPVAILNSFGTLMIALGIIVVRRVRVGISLQAEPLSPAMTSPVAVSSEQKVREGNPAHDACLRSLHSSNSHENIYYNGLNKLIFIKYASASSNLLLL